MSARRIPHNRFVLAVVRLVGDGNQHLFPDTGKSRMSLKTGTAKDGVQRQEDPTWRVTRA